jgi:hypothetical protein
MSVSKDDNLTRKQEALIVALLTKPTHEEAAAEAGVSTATLRRWLLTPAFQDAFRRARRAVVEGAIGRLQHAAGKAVETLVRNLNCGSPAAEIRAALGILEHSVKAVELLDLLERVEQIERFMKEHSDNEVDQPDSQVGGTGESPGAA